MVDFSKTAANQAGVFGIIKTSNPQTFQAGFQALKYKSVKLMSTQKS
jgi:hypothetical protein